MDEQNLHKITSSGDCPSLEQMYAYKNEELSEHENHFIEKHLLDCEMCLEVFEHLQEADKEVYTDLTSTINKKVETRITQKKKPVIYLQLRKYASIAAVLAGIIFTVNYYINSLENTSTGIADRVILQNEDLDLEKGKRNNQDSEVSASDNINADEQDLPEPKTEEGQMARASQKDGDRTTEISHVQDDKTGKDGVAVSEAEKEIQHKGISIGDSVTKELLAWVAIKKIESVPKESDDRATDKKISKRRMDNNYGFAPETVSENAANGYPEFHGGNEQFIKYLNEKTAALVQEDQVRGKSALVNLTVLPTGEIGEVIVEKGINKTVDAKLKAIFKNMPSWIPGNVKVKYLVEVTLMPAKD